MTSRRNILAGSAAAAGTALAGCLGVLGEIDDGEEDQATGPDDLSPIDEPTTTILVRPQVLGSNEVDIQGDPKGADRIEYYLDDEKIFTLQQFTHTTTIEYDAQDGQTVEAVAVYENGEEKVIDERCISCQNGDGAGDSTGDSGIDFGDSDGTTDRNFGDSDGSTDPDFGDSDGSTDPISTREEVMDTRTSISEDGYHYWGFELNRQAELSFSYTVRSGPDIDVFVVEESELTEYENSNRFLSYMSSDGISGNESGVLSSGTYYIIVDNTNAGSVSPPTNLNDDEVDVEIEAHVDG